MIDVNVFILKNLDFSDVLLKCTYREIQDNMVRRIANLVLEPESGQIQGIYKTIPETLKEIHFCPVALDTSLLEDKGPRLVLLPGGNLTEEQRSLMEKTFESFNTLKK